MKLRGRLGLSRQLQVLAAVLFASILGITAQQGWRTRSALLEETERQMARLDMVFAEQTGRALESVDLIVRGVLDHLHADPDATADPSKLQQFLAARASGVHQMMGLGVADANGVLTDASNPVLAQSSFPPEIRQEISKAINRPTASLSISDPFRLSDGTWSALLLRPEIGRDGVARAAVVAFLNLSYFEDFYKAVELTENGAIVLHKRDGIVLARYPHSDRLEGASYADLPPFKDILAHGMAGTLLMDSPLDGAGRVLAIRALKAFPVAVNISVGESQVLRIWRRQAVIFGLSATAAGLLVVGLLLQLARRTSEVEGLVSRLQDAKSEAEAASRNMAREMEERERVEQALRQAQRSEAIGQITGGVAHDFNNLLAIIMGNLDLLETSEGRNTQVMGKLATMRSAVERGATLTGQLLAFARRQPLVPRPTDLNQLLAGLRDLLQSALGSRIELVMSLRPKLGPVLIDKAQMELVVLNLAINARDAMPNGGTLSIETRTARRESTGGPDDLATGEYVLLIVRDTGTGMTPDVLRRAFEPFFTTKEVGRGSGLGLSQAYGTVRQLGGGIEIESAPGKGTAIRIYLQRAPTDEAPASNTLTGRRESRTTRSVLLVDDDHPVRATMSAVLSQRGYNVMEACGGDEALELLEEKRADILLTDVVMPQMTGPELARRVRLRWPNLPVVFISGYTDPNALAGQGGLLHLVRKPARPEELVEAIELAMEAIGTTE